MEKLVSIMELKSFMFNTNFHNWQEHNEGNHNLHSFIEFAA